MTTGLRLAVTLQRVIPSKGGAETYVADLCRRLAAAGHVVDLVAEDWDEAALDPAVRRCRVAVAGRSRTARIRSFADRAAAVLQAESHRFDCTVGFINTWGVDVLIPQGGVHGASLEHNARRFPAGWRRSLYLAAKNLNPRTSLYREIEGRQFDARSMTGAWLVVAVSQMVKGHLARFHGFPADRVRVVPNAIDASRLAVADPDAARSAFRDAHALAPDDVVALFVGHNAKLKGLPDLLRALRLRLDRDPNARPIRLIACGGFRVAPVERLARRLGLERDVRLVGFVPDVRQAFHAADMFVLPTYYDPCSLVVFEALACGLPVITTAYNGAGELIEPGRSGFVIPAPDASGLLADALDRLAEPSSRGRTRRAAAELGRSQTFDVHLDRMVRVFEEAAALRRGPSPVPRPHVAAASPHANPMTSSR
jgi:UDP-glucose:(heptosyl)LPS alpha-1,3-glucosyltransferase